jgi:hypothetical protein
MSRLNRQLPNLEVVLLTKIKVIVWIDDRYIREKALFDETTTLDYVHELIDNLSDFENKKRYRSKKNPYLRDFIYISDILLLYISDILDSVSFLI